MALGDFDVDPVEAQGVAQRPGYIQAPPDHWYNGLAGDFAMDGQSVSQGPIGRGIGQGEAKALSLLSGAVHGVADQVDASGWAPAARMWWGYEPGSVQQLTDRVDAFARRRVAELAPDPKTNGVASIMIQGLADVGSTAALATMLTRGAGAGAAITSAVEGYTKYRDLLDQGVDADTAGRMGSLEALSTGAALAAPYALPLKALGFAGSGLRVATQMATGAAVNTGLSAFNRFASHQVLENAGYPAMADQYRVMDGTALASDAALGAIFGYLGDHGSVKAKELQDTIATAIKDHETGLSKMADAAMTVRLAHIDATDLAPGIPATPGAAGAHKAAMEKALADLTAGRSVDVSDTGVDRQTFVPKPSASGNLFAQVLREEFERAGVPQALSAVDIADRELAARRGQKIEEPSTPAAPVSREPQSAAPALPREAEFAAPSDQSAIGETAPVARAAENEDAAPGLPKRNFKTPDPREDSILQYLAKHERGLSLIEGEQQGLDPADMNSQLARVGIKRAFRKKGMSFDEAAEMLGEEGYPVEETRGGATGPTPHKLLELIDDELRGKPHHSTQNTRAIAEFEAERAHDEQLKAEFAAADRNFAQEPQPYQDMSALAAKAHEHDPDATEAALESQADDREVAARLEAIIAEGRARAEHAAALRDQQGGPVSERERSREALPRETPRASGGDLLGDDTRAAQALADETRRRDVKRNTGQESVETGRPDDLFSRARNQIDLVDAALAERPDLSVVDERGREMSAAGTHELAQAKAEQTVAEAPKMFDAAVTCFLRRGA